MTTGVAVEGFKKTFRLGLGRRPFVAARGITFSVEVGEIFGFLGPNGAGKTTTIKAILGLIRPDAGTLSIFGEPPESPKWRSRVGYMPENPNFYDYLSGLEMVTWFGRLMGLARHEAETQGRRALQRVGLNDAIDRRLRSYSKGMLQRAGLAACLVGDPALLILDEPMTGLDPMGRHEIRALLLELRHEGKTVIYSTHILPDVELTCDRVTIVQQGATLKTGRLVDILSETTRGVRVSFQGIDDDLLKRIVADHPTASRRDDEVVVDLASADLARELAAAMQQAGAKLSRFEPIRDDLETIFVRSLGTKGAAS